MCRQLPSSVSRQPGPTVQAPRPGSTRASVKHVQRMLGHKDAAMTLNVYASLFEDDLDDVSDRLDAALLEAAAACVRP